MTAKIVVKARVSPYFWDLVKKRLGMEGKTDTEVINGLINRVISQTHPEGHVPLVVAHQPQL